jgi:hypothetical protein
MRASQVLQKCLCRSLEPMHEARSRVLLRSVEALLAGRRFMLMDIARAWLGAERVRVPLKAFDRLLSNPEQRRDAAWQYMAVVTRRGAVGLPAGESLRTIVGRFGIGYGTAQRMLCKLPEVNPKDWSSEAGSGH